MLRLLKDQIKKAETDLLAAAQENPLFGLFNCLRLCLEEVDFSSQKVKERQTEWQPFLADLVATIYQAIAVVKPVLCNSSPEGNLPDKYAEDEGETMDDDAGDGDDDDEDDGGNDADDVGPKHQVILSCCWRTVKAATYTSPTNLFSVLSPFLISTPLFP